MLIEKSKTATKHFLEEFEKKKQLESKDTEYTSINIENRNEKVMGKTSNPTTTTTTKHLHQRPQKQRRLQASQNKIRFEEQNPKSPNLRSQKPD